MAILRRRGNNTASPRATLAIGLLLCPWVTDAGQDFQPGFPLRNQNPFLQIFGLPPFQSATLVGTDTLEYDLSLDIANHADAGDAINERFVIDGETYFLSLSLRRRVGDRLELGVDVPVVSHADGFLDNAIENWHDVFGMSNSKRRGPANQLSFSYVGAGSIEYELDSPEYGLGDVQLTAAIPIREANEADDLAVALRAGIKLPTGDAESLLGSGAVDLSFGAYIDVTNTLWDRNLDISAFVGALILGEGDVLPEIQRGALPYGGIAATWHITHRLGITTQLSAQGAYFDSELEELGGNSLQLGVGGYYRLQDRASSLGFAIVEDLSANATTDFAVHISLRKNGGW